MVEEFLKNTEHMYFVKSSIEDTLRLFDNYCNNNHQYFFTLYEFFSKKHKDKKKADYYLELMR